MSCPGTAAPKIVPPSPVNGGLALHPRRSCQAFPHCDRLRKDHAPWSHYFLLISQRLGGLRDVAAPLVEWYGDLHRPVAPPVGATPV